MHCDVREHNFIALGPKVTCPVLMISLKALASIPCIDFNVSAEASGAGSRITYLVSGQGYMARPHLKRQETKAPVASIFGDFFFLPFS